MALSNVIHQLSKVSKKYINYRDSKLTRILQPALGGNAKTLIICTISQARANYQETLNTILFGVKAKKIKNVVRVNEGDIDDENKLALALQEIELLKEELLKKSNTEIKEETEIIKEKIKEKTEEIDILRSSLAANLISKTKGILEITQLYDLELEFKHKQPLITDDTIDYQRTKLELEKIKRENDELEGNLERERKNLEYNKTNRIEYKPKDLLEQKDKIEKLQNMLSEQKILIQNLSLQLMVLKGKESLNPESNEIICIENNKEVNDTL